MIVLCDDMERINEGYSICYHFDEDPSSLYGIWRYTPTEDAYWVHFEETADWMGPQFPTRELAMAAIEADMEKQRKSYMEEEV